MLLPEMKVEYYVSGEYVVWEGECSTEMYFIIHGLLEVQKTVAREGVVMHV